MQRIAGARELTMSVRKLLIAAVLVGGASMASAQDLQFAPPISSTEGAGYKISDGAVLHTGAGAELGYVSNVFYMNSSPVGSALARVRAYFGVATLNAERGGKQEQRSVNFRFDVNGAYQEYLSGDSNVTAQRDVAVTALGRLVINPAGKGSIGIDDSFVRAVQPNNFEGPGNQDRDINRSSIWARYRPGEGAIEMKGGYAFNFDIFEASSLKGLDRTMHEAFAGVKWQYLPITRFTLDYTQFFVNPNSSAKEKGDPMTIVLGASTLFSAKTHAAARVGYGNGFYTKSNYSNVVAGVDLSYLPTPLSKVTLSYDHTFADSLFSNFYVDDVARVRIDTTFSGRYLVRGKVEYRHRTYEGLPTPAAGTTYNSTVRNDNIFNAELGADYQLNERYYLGAGYLVTVEQTNFRFVAGSTQADPSFTRHEFFGKFTAAF